MKSQIGRVYILAIALLLFFVLWATVSAHPWSSKAAVDPRVAKLQAREQQVKKEVQRARKVVTARWKNYNQDLQRRQAQIAVANRRRQAAWARAMAIARSRRRVVYRTVVGTASAGAGGGTGGGGVVVSSGGSSSGGGGGSVIVSSGGGGGGGGSVSVAAPPPIASVSAGSPASSSGTS
jgi:hypothetical protein